MKLSELYKYSRQLRDVIAFYKDIDLELVALYQEEKSRVDLIIGTIINDEIKSKVIMMKLAKQSDL